MRLYPWSALLLLAVPLASAAAGPTHNPHDPHIGRDAAHRRRGLFDNPATTTDRDTSTTPTSTGRGETSNPPTSTTPTSTTQTSTTPTSTTNSPSSTTNTSTTPTSTRMTTSATVRTNDNGEIVTQVVTVPASATSSAAPTNNPDSGGNDSSGPGKGTYIGLGVAGGVAALALVGFLVWKFTNKRFSQFDNDEGGDIEWPQPKEELVTRPIAPAMSGAASTTASSVDLTRDPYAVPPLPQQNPVSYYDDPSGTAAAAYYDPYRGPVPQTFHSPPESMEGHVQPYPPGEAIPMNTYASSGRQSPGPGVGLGYGSDPYARSQSPGPNAAYGTDPYAGRRSPGPMAAYGAGPVDPMGRSGTPLARVGTPGGVSYGAPTPQPDLMRVGTPLAYGRASPGPGVAYGAPAVDPYGRPYGQ